MWSNKESNDEEWGQDDGDIRVARAEGEEEGSFPALRSDCGADRDSLHFVVKVPDWKGRRSIQWVEGKAMRD